MLDAGTPLDKKLKTENKLLLMMDSQFETSEPETQSERDLSQRQRKRVVWSSAEVRLLLTLIKEKKIVGLMDGKRLRVSEIFMSLVDPMKRAGYVRDGSQLLIKFKNLKCKYSSIYLYVTLYYCML